MNGVTRISSEQDVMMITFTEADTASALADALTAFAQKGVVVDMIRSTARARAARLLSAADTARSIFLVKRW